MNIDETLRNWIDAEKVSAVPPHSSAQGWQRLASAVTSGVPAMSVPFSSIQLVTPAMFAEGAAVAVVVGAIGAAAILATAPESHHASSKSAAVSSSRATPPRTAELDQQAQITDGTVVSEPSRDAKLVPSRVLPNASIDAPVAPAAAHSVLDEELQLLARAKRDIDRGQPHLAQVWLDEHRARFPTGVLSAERDGLGVLMACGGGNSTVARARAEEFATKYPGSPLLDRIRRACHLDATRENPK
jgi:hypothetical protein